MLETIAFKGITSDSPDGYNPEGELSISHNIIYENGALQPIMPPKAFIISHMNEDRDLVFIHRNASFDCDHYIIFQKSDSTLHFFNETFSHGITMPKPPATTMPIEPEIKPASVLVSENSTTTDNPDQPLIAITAESINGFKSISAIGNTLVIATADGLAYAVWKEGKYNYLGTNMPQVDIEFSLGGAASMLGTVSISAEIPYDDPATDPHKWHNGSLSVIHWHARGLREKALDEVLSKLLPEINEYIVSQGRFYQPFFVRYAYKLYDGSHAFHSAPILMLPTIMIPKIQVSGAKSEDNQLKFTMDASLIYHHSLLYRTLRADRQKLEEWKDIIVGIDFFISAPIYTYSQSTPPQKRTTSVYDELKYMANAVDADAEELLDSKSGSTDTVSSWRPPYGSGGADEITVPLYDGTYNGVDRFFKKENDYSIFPFERNTNFIDELTSCSLFYFYTSIALEDIEQKDDFGVCPVKPSDIDLGNLQTRQTLKDDYQSHHSIIAGNSITYNNRVQLSNISVRIPRPFPIRTVMPYLSRGNGINVDWNYNRPPAVSPEDYLPQYPTELAVVCPKEGVGLCSILKPDLFDNSNPDLSPIYLSWGEQSFPRWIYYPDASAKELIVKIVSNNEPVYYRLPLKMHPTLNGAYFFRGFSPFPLKKSDPVSFSVNDTLAQSNKIYTSEVNNPFVFNPEGINAVGSGAVIGIATASRPLSQGQFGQFPLYAFTTEGIWALAVNEVGLYNSVQPISREVCLDSDAITPLDSSVAFLSKRGVMLVAGNEVQCISQALDGVPSTDSWINPPFEIPEPVNFHEFFKKARIAYNYAFQRLIIINSEYTEAFVCSLKSGAWATMDSSFVEPINAYPATLIKGYRNGTQMLYDFDLNDSDSVNTVIITRPFAIESSHLLKSVRDVVLDADIMPTGYNRNKPWKAVIGLAGSRNLTRWHTIARREGKAVRGVSGTPYQFHRLCIAIPLTKHDSIIGATMEAVPKYTRKLR